MIFEELNMGTYVSAEDSGEYMSKDAMTWAPCGVLPFSLDRA